MLTVHHLRVSRSERIVWLCEELDIPYTLDCYVREPLVNRDGSVTPAMGLAPPAYKALHAMGSAPVITDGELVLAESGAIIGYLLGRHDPGTLKPGPASADFPAVLYWAHFAADTLQPMVGRSMFLHRLGVIDGPLRAGVNGAIGRSLDLLEARLGAFAHVASDAFTVADIMLVFPLTTMRYFAPLDLRGYPNTLAYLQRIGARPAYRRAMAKGDPDLIPLLT